MATTKRSRPSSGFYRLLDSLSNLDYDQDTPRKSRKLHVVGELPQGVYRVERLVAERKKVVHQTLIQKSIIDLFRAKRNILYFGRDIPKKLLVG